MAKRTKKCEFCGIKFTREWHGYWQTCCSKKCSNQYRLLAKMDKNPTISYAKSYMKKFVKPICKICGLKNKWNGKKIVLHIDHIDGNRKNNNRKNLRWLCPNCHSQTETWGNKNISTLSRRKMRLGGLRGNKNRYKK